ncbi:MAG: FGGY-family carbohydrate kinase, partial [Defluviitaleaceae bacterium]|nr:FGGY-family carbohydrate kinase [Defluviitaleaceae bacterium]
GVSYALAQILDIFRESAVVQHMRVIGGGAGSVLWRQILADVCRVEIRTTDAKSDAATSLGAAIIAMVSIGVYKNFFEAAKIINDNEKTTPNFCNSETYAHMFKKYLKLYPSLKKIF